ncbi:hypothetical protein SAMN03080602_01784 [Arenibacter troitsensis]|uniref:Uncharacterized protein n=1 Tax=Arenibacter troitsensis TaxID=188872 RepID=A0A1X7JH96_9FLAO|nr:hypothetical protein SAMN03080602_01784 [Arenibacter troitsensis]
MEKFNVTNKNKCKLMSTRRSKIDFLLNYSKSLYIIKCDNCKGELDEHCLN